MSHRHGADDEPGPAGPATLAFFLVVMTTTIAFLAVGGGMFAQPPTVRLHVMERPTPQISAGVNADGIDMTQTAGIAADVDAKVPACDVDACSLTYRSFRASDCTFQPYSGQRRLCRMGSSRGR